MNNIMVKELKLSASVLSFPFVLFGFMFFLPGYPILCGAFFITLGIFKSFQNAVQTNDILFSALLPIAKKDTVKGKFAFACLIEACGALLMGVATAFRMTLFADFSVYRTNALMNANLFALGMAFFIFGLFNMVFIGGFFKTAYKFNAPFFVYTALTFIVIGIGEALHHIPMLGFLNSFGAEHLTAQIISLLAGIASFLLLTFISYRLSCIRFEKTDL